jgi:putative transposase
VYHITSRGNAREDIFRHDADRVLFLDILCSTAERYNWLIHAYCLMGNHYHLVVETPEGNLSAGMRQLNGVYTQDFNRRYGRVGHVLQGRYKAIVVEKESYLLALCRYAVLNPVRAGLVRRPNEWRWSSYRATVGKAKGPECLTTDWLLLQFARGRDDAVERYRTFVREGMGDETPWTGLAGQVALGGERFLRKVQRLVQQGGELPEVPRVQRYLARKSLEEMFSKVGDSDTDARNKAMCRAYEQGYSMAQIARQVGVHYSTVSRAVRQQEKARR